MTALKAAFFVKNLPNWERVLRIVVAAAAVLLALLALPAPRNWMLACVAAGFGATGLIGFCPACALVGRRLRRQE